LRKNLEQQVVLLVTAGDHILAKAGTNARGLYWDQIGGVYTIPEWRGRGIAAALVEAVARDRLLSGRKVALFVKTVNTFAKKAYIKAGFSTKTHFLISYF